MDAASNSSLANGLRRELQEQLGDALICDEEIHSRYSTGEVSPLAVVLPKSIPQLSSALQTANKHRASILLWGGGTSIPLGTATTGVKIVVDMTGLDKIVSHEIDNFTVTVQAGVRLETLQQKLRAKQQFLPLDLSSLEKATLGGIAATNASGPWRLLYGSARDLILGMKVVLADGRVVSFGGSTMKNVAGYDVGKLFIGSYGALGAICELTLRLYSIPEKEHSIIVPVSTAGEAFSVAEKAIHLLPAAVLTLNNTAAEAVLSKTSFNQEKGGWMVAIDLLGDSVAVERQTRAIANYCSRYHSTSTAEERVQVWNSIRGLLDQRKEYEILCRMNLPPGNTEQWENRLHEALSDKLAVLCPGTGRIWIRWRPANQQSATETIEMLRSEAERLGGHLIVESTPAEWQRDQDILRQLPEELSLFKAIKKSLDPKGILGSSRFIGGA